MSPLQSHMTRDHPRACGAHMFLPMSAAPTAGSSPRMRGSHFVTPEPTPAEGIIPAHAGLTNHCQAYECTARDHPRACGAHIVSNDARYKVMGSSPRMRGSRCADHARAVMRGIIPAHAGLTCPASALSLRQRDHPRACGAHGFALGYTTPWLGSSPRMRGSH